jgi:hypothetical protein
VSGRAVSACRLVGVFADNSFLAWYESRWVCCEVHHLQLNADTPKRRYANTLPLLRSEHDDDDDLAVSPVWSTDEKGTTLPYFRLGFHDLFSPFHEQQFNQILPVGSERGARQHHLDVASRDEQILGLVFNRDLALGDDTVVGVSERSAERAAISGQVGRQLQSFFRIRGIKQTTPGVNRSMDRRGKAGAQDEDGC